MLLNRLNEEFQKTIVMVTHDPQAAGAAHRMVHLDKGDPPLRRADRDRDADRQGGRMKYLRLIWKNVFRKKTADGPDRRARSSSSSS